MANLAGGEGLVKQTEDGSGQQNDQRPNHAPDHPLENVDPGSLGFNFSFDLSDLSLEPGTLRVDLRTLRINLSSENGDLGSENGNNILSGQAAVFLRRLRRPSWVPRPRYAALGRALR